MEWQTVSGGGGTFMKFSTEGQTLSGTLTGVREGEFGKLYDIKTESGLVTISDSHALRETLPGLVGRLVRIEYQGMKPTKAGRTVKSFLVQVAPPNTGGQPLVEDHEDDALPF